MGIMMMPIFIGIINARLLLSNVMLLKCCVRQSSCVDLQFGQPILSRLFLLYTKGVFWVTMT